MLLSSWASAAAAAVVKALASVRLMTMKTTTLGLLLLLSKVAVEAAVYCHV